MRTFYLILLSFLMTMSCKHSTDSLPVKNLLSFDILKNLTIQLVGYDSLHIVNPPKAVTTEMEVKLIRIYQNYAGKQQKLNEIVPSYSTVSGGFQIVFDIPVKVDRRTVFANLKVEFIVDSSRSITIDTSVAVFKFPYPETEFLFYHSELLLQNNIIQSFDFVNNKLYLHGYGPSGLYFFDLNTSQKQMLVDTYPGGDHLSATTDRVFLDFEHNMIYVYDLNSNQLSSEPIITIPDNEKYEITGMTVIGQELYVLWGEPDVHVYDFQGNLLQTIPYGKYTYGLTHKDGILYSIDFNAQEITRFDLQQQSFLSPRPFPTIGTDIIQIEDEFLYFTDYYKQIMARVPMDALN